MTGQAGVQTTGTTPYVPGAAQGVSLPFNLRVRVVS
jgi:hypothetical protein